MYDDDEPLNITCRGCDAVEPVNSFNELKHHEWHRSDAYGLSTGVWCESCYQSSKYPYRRDRYYDPSFCGERMDDDY